MLNADLMFSILYQFTLYAYCYSKAELSEQLCSVIWLGNASDLFLKK